MYPAPLLSDIRSSSARTTSWESGCRVFHRPACTMATDSDAGTTHGSGYCSWRARSSAARRGTPPAAIWMDADRGNWMALML